MLDVNLGGEVVYPLADALAAEHVPFIFVTGYSDEEIEGRFASVPVLQKPIERDALKSIFGRRSAHETPALRSLCRLAVAGGFPDPVCHSICAEFAGSLRCHGTVIESLYFAGEIRDQPGFNASVRCGMSGPMALSTTEHTTKAFDVDLQSLSRMIAEMGGHAEHQLVQSIDALTKQDRDRAERVVSTDEVIDTLQRQIEEKAIATIATRQPLAVDLRDIVAVLRISSDLERIGDLAKNIGRRVTTLSGQEMPAKALRGVRHMATLALVQLRDVLDAYASRDVAKAIEVWKRDEEIDAMYTSLFRELLTYMMEDPGTITFGIHMLFCAKNIERMGDHCTNIAEAIHYMVEGRRSPRTARKPTPRATFPPWIPHCIEAPRTGADCAHDQKNPAACPSFNTFFGSDYPTPDGTCIRVTCPSLRPC